MFEAYFYDKHTQTNYHVFRLLKARQHDSFTINRLSLEAKLSYSQAYNAFQDIMTALQAKNAHGSGPLNETEYARLSADVTVDDYRYFLLSDSMAFRFFDYAFRQSTPDVHQFCSDWGLSISTLRRRIAPFKRYLTSKGLRLNTSTWALEGDELKARMLILTFYNMAYRGVGWPFSERAFQTAKQRYLYLTQGQARLFGPSTTSMKQELLLLAVQAMRIEQGHILAVPDRIPDLFAEFRAPGTDFPAETLPPLTKVQRQCERNFYDFACWHFISLSHTVSARDQAVMRVLGQPATCAHHFAHGLLSYLQAQCPPADRQEESQLAMLNVNLHRVADTYLTLQGDFAKRLDFMDLNRDLAESGRLPSLIKTYFDHLDRCQVGALVDYYNAMYQVLYILLAPAFPGLNADHQLKVAVIVDAGTFMSRDLNSFLNALTFIDLVSPARNVLPDVIITSLSVPQVLKDYYSPERLKQVTVIHWQPEVADEDFFNLLSTLSQVKPRIIHD